MARSSSVGGFFGEFKAFLAQGNVVDLAVAVIMGGAFAKIVDSLMTDIITPVILSPALKAAKVDDLASFAPNGIKVGLFLSAVLNFVVVAFVIFLMVKSLQEAKRRTAREEALAEPEVDVQVQLVESINSLNATIASKL
ncbi:MAG: large conductance mechanosensitive channel protein MscL [Synechococcales cyanobacterium RM1_1_8]|nr:large conductance mechanosensitive channel protein MscL [Synechococcales cyanobacterium RM1_1_8]